MARYVSRALSAPVLINDNAGYMVLIGGKPVFVVAGSLSFQNSVGRRSQASFTVHSVDGATHYQQYQQVRIYDRYNYLVFSGYITQPKEQKPGFKPSLNHSISCTDQHYLADKRRVTASYTNKTCGYIVQDILRTILSQEGVTEGLIYDGPTPGDGLYPSDTLYPGGNVGLIPNANFVYAKVSDVLDALVKSASTSGVPYFWSIDQFKRLYFVPYTTITNDTVVDGTKIDYVLSPPSVTRANPTYRNTQYVTGGTAETLPQDESRKGDGTATAWTMSFELAHVPTITVNGVSKTVGISGVETGKDFYWNKGSNVISQDSSGTKLTTSDTLRVQYVGQYPSTVIAANGAQIDYQASIDGTSGINEDVETDSSIASVDDGLAEASNLLTRYATQSSTLQFTTLVSGYDAGQLIPVNLPEFDLSEKQMLIESVTGGDQIDGINLWWTITAIIGPYDTNWVSFFAKLFKQPITVDPINVGESQVVTNLQQLTLNMAPTMSMSANVYACPLPSDTLYPSDDLVPC